LCTCCNGVVHESNQKKKDIQTQLTTSKQR
jgi:hypothetical protein